MAGRTRVLVLRLRNGGVLLVAPAAILPWPRLLSPRAQRLQEFGLRSTLTDPVALSRLRAEYAQLVGAPGGRRAAVASPEELVATLLNGARTGRLTVIFGYGEPKASTGRPGELPQMFAEHPVIGPAARGVRAPALDPKKGPPKTDTPLPKTFEERLHWVCARSPSFMAEDAAQQMREFFSGAALATTVALLALWASSHVIGVGFVVDAALFAAAVWQLGAAALKAFEQLKAFFDLTRNASSWADLDKAAKLLAAAVVTLGAVLFRQLLRRVGGRVGRSGGEASAPPPPKVGKPAVKPAAPATATARAMAGAPERRAASDVMEGVRLRNQLTSREIAGGHAFEKHVLGVGNPSQAEFSGLGIRTRDQFAKHIENVINNPSQSGALRGGREYFYDQATNTLVIKNPRAVDGGTAFRPVNPDAYLKILR